MIVHWIKKVDFFFLYFVFLLGLYSCGNSAPIGTVKDNSTHQQVEDNVEYLVIQGKDIWIRDKPSVGDVIMKLQEGDSCIVLAKGDEETIREVTDYWYEINYRDKIGWVFGSQTTIKQISADTLIPDLVSEPESIIEDYSKSIRMLIINGDYEMVQDYIHPEEFRFLWWEINKDDFNKKAIVKLEHETCICHEGCGLSISDHKEQGDYLNGGIVFKGTYFLNKNQFSEDNYSYLGTKHGYSLGGSLLSFRGDEVYSTYFYESVLEFDDQTCQAHSDRMWFSFKKYNDEFNLVEIGLWSWGP